MTGTANALKAAKTPLYAARLNAFKIGAEAWWPGRNRITAADLVTRAATVEGLNAVDLNYPDHFADQSPEEMARVLDDNGMALNGLAMRYYTEPGFKLGAFTHPDAGVRQKAVDITRKGIDACRAMGGGLMTLWMGQDGWDYSFQADYARQWDWSVEAMQAVADHDPDVDIAIEYKPNEPRAHALMPNLATTLLALRDIGRSNTGVTLDFAHVLYAGETPAFAAFLAGRQSRLLGVHLNDGYGKRDDGLMVATVHPVQTLELLHVLRRLDYDRAIYFDTFPDVSGLDPVAEAETNIAAMAHLLSKVDRLAARSDLDAAIAAQDAPASQRIVHAVLFGEGA